VRAVAAEVLGELGAAEARGALRAALKDKEGIVALRAAVALSLLGEEQGKEILRRTAAQPLKVEGREIFEQIVAAEALARLGEPKGRDLLVLLLKHPRPAVGLFAAEGLSNLKDPAPVEFLRKVAQESPDRKNRMWASWTLARLADDAGRPGAVTLLSDTDEYARLEAAWTLGQMGRLAPLAPLQKALADPSLLVRFQAAWSMSEIVLAAPPPPRPAQPKAG
jgi:HEAT repeat protein